MDEQYENCAGRTFYRIVSNDPPTARDFYPYRDLGRPLLDNSTEGYENWVGVSVYERRRQAVALAKYLIRRRRPAGTLVAEITIPPDLPVRGKRMGGEGHYNLFETPEILLKCYRRVVADLSRRPEEES
jgi:hypothetical protein